VLIQCQDLREVHQQLARYIRLLGQIGQPVLESHGQRAHLLWQWPYPSAAPMGVAQFMLAARATFSRWLTGRSDLVFDAFFHFPEPAHTHIHTNAHQRIFGGRLHYQQPSSKLVFDEAALNLPVAIADEGIRLQVEARAQSRMAALLQEPALIQRLKSVLRQGLPQGQATVSYAAHALGLTARSLQRHLQAEGLAFQAVLDEVRQSQAEQWLAEGRANLSQIAFLLGYRDQTAFQAAFKRWTGLPPAAWRRVRG
jgi:AraC-like DNA-binding protein